MIEARFLCVTELKISRKELEGARSQETSKEARMEFAECHHFDITHKVTSQPAPDSLTVGLSAVRGLQLDSF